MNMRRRIFTVLAALGSLATRAPHWNGLSNESKMVFADTLAERWATQHALLIYPGIRIGLSNLVDSEIRLGHIEAALSVARELSKQSAGRADSAVSPEGNQRLRLAGIQDVAMLLGEYARAISLGHNGWRLTDGPGRYHQQLINNIAVAMARQHDGTARAALQQLPPPPIPIDRGPRASAQLLMEAGLENWRAVIALQPSVEQTWVRFNQGWDLKTIFATQIRPWVALAKAMTGDIADAEALIATTPGDCYDCVRIRGLIAEAAKQPGRADYWLARAVQQAPSIPFAYTDWGNSLLVRGKLDDAIEKFELAYNKGPHFADPLEMWGEALMAKNQSHLALAKFEEADKYAPNWGRLHLKWGEALFYAGKKDEARAQYQKASTLDLTAGDKAELARVSHG